MKINSTDDNKEFSTQPIKESGPMDESSFRQLQGKLMSFNDEELKNYIIDNKEELKNFLGEGIDFAVEWLDNFTFNKQVTIFELFSKNDIQSKIFFENLHRAKNKEFIREFVANFTIDLNALDWGNWWSRVLKLEEDEHSNEDETSDKDEEEKFEEEKFEEDEKPAKDENSDKDKNSIQWIEVFLKDLIQQDPELIRHICPGNSSFYNYQDLHKALPPSSPLPKPPQTTEFDSFPRRAKKIMVDMEEYPTLSANEDCSKIKQLLIGDTHANLIMLYWKLVRHGYITCTEEEFNQFVETVKEYGSWLREFREKCYFRYLNEFDETSQEGAKFREKILEHRKYGVGDLYNLVTDQEVLDLIENEKLTEDEITEIANKLKNNENKFDTILASIKFNEKAGELILIGDNFADRTDDDGKMAKFLSYVKMKGIHCTSLLSNHDIETISSYTEDLNNPHKEKDFILLRERNPSLRPYFVKSLINFKTLLVLMSKTDDSMYEGISRDFVTNMRSYMQSLKLIHYVLDPTTKKMVIYSHAPICLRNIKYIAQVLGLNSDVSSNKERAALIDQINVIFDQDKWTLHEQYTSAQNLQDLYCNIYFTKQGEYENSLEYRNRVELAIKSNKECKSFICFGKDDNVYYFSNITTGLSNSGIQTLLGQDAVDFRARYESKLMSDVNYNRPKSELYSPHRIVNSRTEWALVKAVENDLWGEEFLQHRKDRVYGFCSWNRDQTELINEIKAKTKSTADKSKNAQEDEIVYSWGHDTVDVELENSNYIFGLDSPLGKGDLFGEYGAIFLPNPGVVFDEVLDVVQEPEKEIQKHEQMFVDKIKKFDVKEFFKNIYNKVMPLLDVVDILKSRLESLGFFDLSSSTTIKEAIVARQFEIRDIWIRKQLLYSTLNDAFRATILDPNLSKHKLDQLNEYNQEVTDIKNNAWLPGKLESFKKNFNEYKNINYRNIKDEVDIGALNSEVIKRISINYPGLKTFDFEENDLFKSREYQDVIDEISCEINALIEEKNRLLLPPVELTEEEKLEQEKRVGGLIEKLKGFDLDYESALSSLKNLIFANTDLVDRQEVRRVFFETRKKIEEKEIMRLMAIGVSRIRINFFEIDFATDSTKDDIDHQVKKFKEEVEEALDKVCLKIETNNINKNNSSDLEYYKKNGLDETSQFNYKLEDILEKFKNSPQYKKIGGEIDELANKIKYKTECEELITALESFSDIINSSSKPDKRERYCEEKYQELTQLNQRYNQIPVSSDKIRRLFTEKRDSITKQKIMAILEGIVDKSSIDFNGHFKKLKTHVAVDSAVNRFSENKNQLDQDLEDACSNLYEKIASKSLYKVPSETETAFNNGVDKIHREVKTSKKYINKQKEIKDIFASELSTEMLKLADKRKKEIEEEQRITAIIENVMSNISIDNNHFETLEDTSKVDSEVKHLENKLKNKLDQDLESAYLTIKNDYERSELAPERVNQIFPREVFGEVVNQIFEQVKISEKYENKQRKLSKEIHELANKRKKEIEEQQRITTVIKDTVDKSSIDFNEHFKKLKTTTAVDSAVNRFSENKNQLDQDLEDAYFNLKTEYKTKTEMPFENLFKEILEQVKTSEKYKNKLTEIKEKSEKELKELANKRKEEIEAEQKITTSIEAVVGNISIDNNHFKTLEDTDEVDREMESLETKIKNDLDQDLEKACLNIKEHYEKPLFASGSEIVNKTFSKERLDAVVNQILEQVKISEKYKNKQKKLSEEILELANKRKNEIEEQRITTIIEGIVDKSSIDVDEHFKKLKTTTAVDSAVARFSDKKNQLDQDLEDAYFNLKTEYETKNTMPSKNHLFEKIIEKVLKQVKTSERYENKLTEIKEKSKKELQELASKRKKEIKEEQRILTTLEEAMDKCSINNNHFKTLETTTAVDNEIKSLENKLNQDLEKAYLKIKNDYDELAPASKVVNKIFSKEVFEAVVNQILNQVTISGAYKNKQSKLSEEINELANKRKEEIEKEIEEEQRVGAIIEGVVDKSSIDFDEHFKKLETISAVDNTVQRFSENKNQLDQDLEDAYFNLKAEYKKQTESILFEGKLLDNQFFEKMIEKTRRQVTISDKYKIKLGEIEKKSVGKEQATLLNEIKKLANQRKSEIITAILEDAVGNSSIGDDPFKPLKTTDEVDNELSSLENKLKDKLDQNLKEACSSIKNDYVYTNPEEQTTFEAMVDNMGQQVKDSEKYEKKQKELSEKINKLANKRKKEITEEQRITIIIEGIVDKSSIDVDEHFKKLKTTTAVDSAVARFSKNENQLDQDLEDAYFNLKTEYETKNTMPSKNHLFEKIIEKVLKQVKTSERYENKLTEIKEKSEKELQELASKRKKEIKEEQRILTTLEEAMDKCSINNNHFKTLETTTAVDNEIKSLENKLNQDLEKAYLKIKNDYDELAPVSKVENKIFSKEVFEAVVNQILNQVTISGTYKNKQSKLSEEINELANKRKEEIEKEIEEEQRVGAIIEGVVDKSSIDFDEHFKKLETISAVDNTVQRFSENKNQLDQDLEDAYFNLKAEYKKQTESILFEGKLLDNQFFEKMIEKTRRQVTISDKYKIKLGEIEKKSVGKEQATLLNEIKKLANQRKKEITEELRVTTLLENAVGNSSIDNDRFKPLKHLDAVERIEAFVKNQLDQKLYDLCFQIKEDYKRTDPALITLEAIVDKVLQGVKNSSKYKELFQRINELANKRKKEITEELRVTTLLENAVGNSSINNDHFKILKTTTEVDDEAKLLISKLDNNLTKVCSGIKKDYKSIDPDDQITFEAIVENALQNFKTSEEYNNKQQELSDNIRHFAYKRKSEIEKSNQRKKWIVGGVTTSLMVAVGLVLKSYGSIANSNMDSSPLGINPLPITQTILDPQVNATSWSLEQNSTTGLIVGASVLLTSLIGIFCLKRKKRGAAAVKEVREGVSETSIDVPVKLPGAQEIPTTPMPTDSVVVPMDSISKPSEKPSESGQKIEEITNPVKPRDSESNPLDSPTPKIIIKNKVAYKEKMDALCRSFEKNNQEQIRLAGLSPITHQKLNEHYAAYKQCIELFFEDFTLTSKKVSMLKTDLKLVMGAIKQDIESCKAKELVENFHEALIPEPDRNVVVKILLNIIKFGIFLYTSFINFIKNGRSDSGFFNSKVIQSPVLINQLAEVENELNVLQAELETIVIEIEGDNGMSEISKI